MNAKIATFNEVTRQFHVPAGNTSSELATSLSRHLGGAHVISTSGINGKICLSVKGAATPARIKEWRNKATEFLTASGVQF